MVMLQKIIFTLALCFLSVASFADNTGYSNSQSVKKEVLSFKTMYGVDGPFIEETNAIRGIPGDELPWVVAKSATGKLFSDGLLVIHVRGLVFTDDDVVPPELRGINDEPYFRAAVSCLSEESVNGKDSVVVKNVVTGQFPATATGNSDIKAKVELPNPCVAPIIFVLSGSEFKWFSVTGFEAPATYP